MATNGSTFETLDYTVEDGIAVVTFTRPEQRNSFTTRMNLELVRAFDLSDTDDSVRAVVVTGQGPTFCAGADLHEGFVGRGGKLSDVQREYVAEAGEIAGVPRDGGGYLVLRIARSLKPVIAAMQGSAVGVGATMTLPMDVRVVAESARIGFVFARRGLVPDAASSWFLPRVVGISRAVEWFATGRVFDAAEAKEAGLASHVVPDGEVIGTAMSIAREIANHSAPVAVAAGRHLLWGMLSEPSPWTAHALDSQAVFDLATAGDVEEGVAAFLEKRPASFPLAVSRDLPSYVEIWPRRPEAL
jgi:enoyl-CoA hydratase/carnithine racemase